MRILTRGDLDGLTSTVLLTMSEQVSEIRFAHPKEVQDGKVPCTSEDIVVNLPYVKGCGMWFDHHVSEEEKLPDIGAFKGKFAVAPSAARVVADHYAKPEFGQFKELLEATDRLDSAQLTMHDVTKPAGWILLGLTLDPRSGLGPEFQKYFRWLAEYIKEVPLAKILEHPEVKKRCERVVSEQAAFRRELRTRAKLRGNVILTDFRGVNRDTMPVGNRFLVFAEFPMGNVEARLFSGHDGKTLVVAVGHSIFNRTCKVNVGKLLAEYGGGGHNGAGTCQLPIETSEHQLEEIIGRLTDRDARPSSPPTVLPRKPAAVQKKKPASKPKPKAKKRPAAKKKPKAKKKR